MKNMKIRNKFTKSEYKSEDLEIPENGLWNYIDEVENLRFGAGWEKIDDEIDNNIMNREILFRGKNLIINKWVYGDLYNITDNSNKIAIGYLNEGLIICNKETICQFTGLTDCESNKIFEGDILQLIDYPDYLFKVEFKYGMFGYETPVSEFIGFGANSNYKFQPNNTDNEFKIVGNIYDNPELLEQINKNFK